MKRIELIGPCGVGKTTLYNKISQISENTRPYKTLKEAYKLAGINQEVPVTNIKLFIYLWLLKSRLFNYKSIGLGRVVLRELWVKKEKKINHDYDPFMRSFDILLAHLKSEENSDSSYRIIKNHLKKIDDYLLLDNFVSEQQFILYDEGMLHWHPGITVYGTKMYMPADLQRDVVLSPAGIIACEQAEDSIFEQLLERKKQGVGALKFRNWSDEQLMEFVKVNVYRHQEKSALFEDNSVPVLHINTGKQMDNNISKIDDFVRSLRD